MKQKNELLRVLEADDLHGQFQKLVEAWQHGKGSSSG